MLVSVFATVVVLATVPGLVPGTGVEAGGGKLGDKLFDSSLIDDT